MIRARNLCTEILEGRLDGKRRQGRPRWTDDIKEWSNRTVAECSRLARDRQQWRLLMHEVISDPQQWGRKQASRISSSSNNSNGYKHWQVHHHHHRGYQRNDILVIKPVRHFLFSETECGLIAETPWSPHKVLLQPFTLWLVSTFTPTGWCAK